MILAITMILQFLWGGFEFVFTKLKKFDSFSTQHRISTPNRSNFVKSYYESGSEARAGIVLKNRKNELVLANRDV